MTALRYSNLLAFLSLVLSMTLAALIQPSAAVVWGIGIGTGMWLMWLALKGD